MAERVLGVRERIERAAKRAGRDPREVGLVGVSKGKPAALLVEGVRAGLTRIGESYVQEARAKLPVALSALTEQGLAPPRWHLVGRLQTNKARDAARLFDVVESVDRERLAVELDRRAGVLGRRLEVLLQVNVSGEAQKAGVAPAELPPLLERCLGLSHLAVRGLMTVPADAPDPEAARPAFAALRELRERCASAAGVPLPVLSMGMSADFEIAIEEGATLVRVGTAIFGPREA